MFYALGADEPVGDFLYNAGLSPYHEHLKAVMTVKVDVHRAYDHVVVLVLDVGEGVGEFARVV